ncbi:A disintegrin and metalloproteinase with thrombospondin motifs 12 [Electrophorus electricus]|uniref:A disintegrin and metalloproteinase with thrombospondin motifs 12 n=1 Tax=Electrophorus electricus TaxID=8005 RepID=UPI0015CFA43F|nr:A disintegrin and metalloproteinase with thrombospondin motifs 12 [Electrophorus electricus]
MPFLRLHLVLLLAVGHVASSGSDYLFPDTEQEHFIRSHEEFFVVHPEKVDEDGRFISHVVSHQFTHGRHKRDLSSPDRRVYYKLRLNGRALTLNLTVNDNLLAKDYALERRPCNLTKGRTRVENACHLLGTVRHGAVEGPAALSTCRGLMGVLTLPGGLFLMEPVRGHTPTVTHPHQPHVIYRTSVWSKPRARRGAHAQRDHTACGVKDGRAYSERVEKDRELWEQEQLDSADRNAALDQIPRRRISPRSVSTERWVETMVVTDSKVLQYHGNSNVESYIFTIMNMVAGIFHDASIGNAIHIILVRLILLQGEEKGLKVVHHADSTLSSFCSWQKSVNPQSDTHPAHHDVALLITRKDICAGRNEPCETLGLSHLSGMCQPHRSCSISEDSGLPVAFTIAHELGHSFGIQHDGQGNDCEVNGRHAFIMSRQLQYDSSPLTWSSCSKDYITRFLDRGWGFCLNDRPSKKDLSTGLLAPGVRYTRQHQCQMQYGPDATFCTEVDNVCQILWCSVNGSCRSKLDSPIDGTRCGPGKWCISGECVIVGKLPETVNGGWGQWSTWSHCSRTCGSGVQSAERECNQPKPEFGGKYCTGERKRYRICNTAPCAQKQPTFRDMQCSEFDTVPYHNQLYQWIPVFHTNLPCELHCRPVSEDFSEKMLDTVTDGTPCFINNSRSICISGVCKAVGCDYGIDSRAEEDLCGVCLGDGSTCETVNDSYTQRDGNDYVDMVLIPAGARDILIHEVEEAGNFLAVRATDSEKYYLNGNFVIQWNGEYQVGGAKFYYERSGNLENLTSPGPTTQPIMVQLLFQESNPGVQYRYTVKKNRLASNKLLEPEYTWKYGAWSDCSATCGLGGQKQPVRCFESEVGVVDEALCDPGTRPSDRHRKCKLMDCPARWWVGGWQPCSASCGPEGVRRRTVLCVRTVAGEERVLHADDCRQLLQPKAAVPCNRHVTCGSAWAVGNWSKCSLTCGGGIKSRVVRCVTEPQVHCDPMTRPRSTVFCNLQSCSSNYRRVSPQNPTPKTPARATTISAHPATPGRDHTLSMPTVSPAHVTSPDVFHKDDGDSTDDDTQTITHRPSMNPTISEEQEGSTELLPPDEGSRYTPGYDYMVEQGDDDTERNESENGIRVQPPATDPNPHTPITTTHPARITVTHTSLTTINPAKTTAIHSPLTTTNLAKTTTTRTPLTTSGPTKITATHTPLTTSNPGTTRSTIHTVVPTIKKTASHTSLPLQQWSSPWWTNGDNAYTATNLRTKVAPVLQPNTPQATMGRPKPRTPHSHPGKKLQAGAGSDINGWSQSWLPATLPATPLTTSHTPTPSDGYGELNTQDRDNSTAFWVVGNWSQCSTTCGLGAVWRWIRCSSEVEADCSTLARPEPARHCNLRPCAAWYTSNWSTCPEGCVSGTRRRDVQCVDTQSGRALRPYHCQLLSTQPRRTLPCTQSCTKPRPQARLRWRHSSWGPCSKSCGGGIKERLVYCPEHKLCDESVRPNSTAPCRPQPCVTWVTEPWQECSRTCGGGVQRRAVWCVSAGSRAVEKNTLCVSRSRPVSERACGSKECRTDPGRSKCKRNTMSSRFCAKLKLLGHCVLRSIRRQCCLTCTM